MTAVSALQVPIMHPETIRTIVIKVMTFATETVVINFVKQLQISGKVQRWRWENVLDLAMVTSPVVSTAKDQSWTDPITVMRK